MSNTDPAAMDAYQGRVHAVMIAAAAEVPANALVNAQSLVDHGEPAEGMLQLAWAITGTNARVPAWIIESIRDLTAELIDAEMLPKNLSAHAI